LHSLCTEVVVRSFITCAVEEPVRCSPRMALKVTRSTAHRSAFVVDFTVALRVVSYIIANSPKLSPAPFDLNSTYGSLPFVARMSKSPTSEFLHADAL
jgi:hypothetical protein